MRYQIKPHPYGPRNVLATWFSVEDYLSDCDTLGESKITCPHGKPETQKMRTPDPRIIDKLTRFTTATRPATTVKAKRKVHDVTGDLVLDRFLIGEPECMLRWIKRAHRDIKVVFSPEAHVDSDSDALYMRGAAVMSLIQSLEAAGNRVELWMGFDTTTMSKHYESQIRVKAANQYTIPTHLAALFCDPSFLRTCEFNMIHHHLGTRNVGYNSGMTLQGDIVLDGSYKSMAPFASVKSAKAWCDAMIAEHTKGKH